MRKHSVRKWLHALLDLLPLVVIPVFMVYSHRHQIDSYSVERTEYRTIHMQQSVINGLPTSLSNWEVDDGTIYFSEDSFTFEDYGGLLSTQTFSNVDVGDKILFSVNNLELNDEHTTLQINLDDNNLFYEFSFEDEGIYQHIFTLENNLINYFYIFVDAQDGDTLINNIQLFNLTQMFGSGNEPTIDKFNTIFPNDYYDVNSNAVAYVPYTRTYNDTDIGSQIFYSLYNSVDKYFNCNKLFSFTGVYNWINFNLFGGNAPLMVDVVYQIIVYEFFMDLIFLIYSVFMFIIDFASNFLEYCFSWSHRGGR